MILEFEKLNHKISLEIDDEPMITLKKKKLVEKSTYNYKLISIKVDGKEVDETGNIYRLIRIWKYLKSLLQF